VRERQSGAPLAATNVKTAGSVCKRRDAVRPGRKEGLQPRASERPAVGCSEKLAGGLRTAELLCRLLDRGGTCNEEIAQVVTQHHFLGKTSEQPERC